MKDRIKKIRKEAGLTQEKFAERLGIKRNTVATYETGKSEPMDNIIVSMCREFKINKDWLRTGNGEMRIYPEDETAEIVSDLLEESNPVYNLVKNIMKTYKKLDRDSQKVIDDFAIELLKEIKAED